MGKKDRKGIGGSITLKAEEEEATEGRLETHTKQMVINYEAGQWCQQGVFLRLLQPVSSLKV